MREVFTVSYFRGRPEILAKKIQILFFTCYSIWIKDLWNRRKQTNRHKIVSAYIVIHPALTDKAQVAESRRKPTIWPRLTYQFHVEEKPDSGSPVPFRILTARFQSFARNITWIHCYAHSLTLQIGDLNAKVGADNANNEWVMGRHVTQQMHENGELLTDFYPQHDLVIRGTITPQRDPQDISG